MKTVKDRVIVEKTNGEERSASGLITLSMSQNKGKVVALGPEVDLTGNRIKEGDTVHYQGGVEISVEGKQVVVLTLKDILVVL